MITQQTAERIWECHREIATANKLLDEIASSEEKLKSDHRETAHAPTLRDAFGRRQHMELGVPCGENGQRLFKVAPQLAKSIIRAHIANKEAELVEANEQAKSELVCVNPEPRTPNPEPLAPRRRREA